MHKLRHALRHACPHLAVAAHGGARVGAGAFGVAGLSGFGSMLCLCLDFVILNARSWIMRSIGCDYTSF